MKTVDEATTQLSSSHGERSVTGELLRLKQEEARPAVEKREDGEPTGDLKVFNREEPFFMIINRDRQ